MGLFLFKFFFGLETLKKAGKVDRFFVDETYVKRIILEGFDLAYVIIEKIKPAA